MQKDFITVTPDSGNGTATVTVAAAQNTGNARNSSIVISGGGMTRTIKVNQQEIEKELVDGTYWGEAYDYNIHSRAERVKFTVSNGVKRFAIDLSQDPLPIEPNREQDKLLYVSFNLISDTECTNGFLETENYPEIQNDDGFPIQINRKASMVEIIMSPSILGEKYELTFELYL